MNFIRAYPGDLVITINPGSKQEAWFVSEWQSMVLLVSATSGELHAEIAQLALRNLDDFHIHLTRIFANNQVQVINKGNARITVTLIRPGVTI